LTEHHARSHHWDLRLEDQGVLLSWALPKGEPGQLGVKRLALRTEDHALDFIDPDYAIAMAAAGDSALLITDSGTYEREVWSPDSRIIVVLTGSDLGTRRLVLTRAARMGHSTWLAQRLASR
jgi:bifunctional non-homologous end joining protein LigD